MNKLFVFNLNYLYVSDGLLYENIPLYQVQRCF